MVKLVRTTPEESLPKPVPTRTVLMMQVGNGDSPKQFAAAVRDEMVIGRGNADEGIHIDLSPYDAADWGVSRQHAAFYYSDDVLFVEDKQSTNGTRINGKTIEAHKRYRLRAGDELEFGRLRVTVRIVRT